MVQSLFIPPEMMPVALGFLGAHRVRLPSSVLAPGVPQWTSCRAARRTWRGSGSDTKGEAGLKTWCEELHVKELGMGKVVDGFESMVFWA